jgi:copper transport protein
LLVKLAVVFVVIAIAAYNRYKLVPRLVGSPDDTWHDPPDATMRRLLSTVRFEAIGLVAVLAVTAVLVVTVPGREPPVGPFNQTVAVGTNQLTFGVTPAQAGRNQVHLTFLTPEGQPASVRSARVELSQPEAGIGPIARDARPAGTGHFILETSDLAIPGTWKIDVLARISDFEQERASFQVPIG